MDVTIDSSKVYSEKFLESDTVKSVVQNIALLLNTKKGTVPMYREFGLPMEFVDKPIDIAETIATLEISEALEEFEPRAKLKDLTITKTKEGTMAVIVEVRINEQRDRL